MASVFNSLPQGCMSLQTTQGNKTPYLNSQFIRNIKDKKVKSFAGVDTFGNNISLTGGGSIRASIDNIGLPIQNIGLAKMCHLGPILGRVGANVCFCHVLLLPHK